MKCSIMRVQFIIAVLLKLYLQSRSIMNVLLYKNLHLSTCYNSAVKYKFELLSCMLVSYYILVTSFLPVDAKNVYCSIRTGL